MAEQASTHTCSGSTIHLAGAFYPIQQAFDHPFNQYLNAGQYRSQQCIGVSLHYPTPPIVVHK